MIQQTATTSWPTDWNTEHKRVESCIAEKKKLLTKSVNGVESSEEYEYGKLGLFATVSECDGRTIKLEKGGRIQDRTENSVGGGAFRPEVGLFGYESQTGHSGMVNTEYLNSFTIQRKVRNRDLSGSVFVPRNIDTNSKMEATTNSEDYHSVESLPLDFAMKKYYENGRNYDFSEKFKIPMSYSSFEGNSSTSSDEICHKEIKNGDIENWINSTQMAEKIRREFSMDKNHKGIKQSKQRTTKKFNNGDYDMLNGNLIGTSAEYRPCNSNTDRVNTDRVTDTYGQFDWSSVGNNRDIHVGRPDMTRSLSYSVDKDIGSARYKRSRSFSPVQDDGMMAASHEDRAINLSAAAEMKHELSGAGSRSVSPTLATHTSNGIMEHTSTSQGMIPTSQVDTIYPPVPSPAVGAAKRKSRTTSDIIPDSLTNGQSILMLAAQHGLTPQQITAMMVSQQTATPQHLQQVMQAQQSLVMQQQQKAQEQALVQLNEQLQLNMLQQTQLMQEKKTNGKHSQSQLQALAVQQQQLVQQIQQLQLQQRQFILACLMQPFSSQQGVISPADMHAMWKEVSAAQNGVEEGIKGAVPNGLGLGHVNGTGLPGGNPLLPASMMGLNGLAHEAFQYSGGMLGGGLAGIKQEDDGNPLYRHGVCKWPGCDTECQDLYSFNKHLNHEHTLDDKNTAQARVQMQIVSQLEIQLTREKELLHAMMQHLHHRRDNRHDNRDTADTEQRKHTQKITSPKPTSLGSPLKTHSSNNSSINNSSSHSSRETNRGTMSPKTPHKPATLSLPHMTGVAGLPPLIIPPQSPLTSGIQSQPSIQLYSQSQSSIPLHSQSEPATPTGLGPMRRRVSDKCNLPISAEIHRNRDFYKNTDVRPPFTYASLIRQGIIESENKQLTLNEVYQWFQTTFAYFRRNEATWKNAVRHNLSLHKCFMRVENVKGAVWTVDEMEFYKRRPQKLTGALPGSPSMVPDNSAIYGDSMNSNLRVALEQSSMLMSQHMSNGSLSDWGGAEDLSLKSQGNSNDSFTRSPNRDDAVFMKPDTLVYQEVEEERSPQSQQDYTSQCLDLSPRGSQRSSPHSGPASLSGGSQHSPRTNPSPHSSSQISPTIGYSHKHSAEPPRSDTYDGRYHRPIESGYSNPESFIGQGEIKEEHDMQMNSHSFNMDQSEALNMKKEVISGDKELESYNGHSVKHAENYVTGQGLGQDLTERSRNSSDQIHYMEGEDSQHNSGRSQQEANIEQTLTNQQAFSPLLHQNKMAAVVSHSIS